LALRLLCFQACRFRWKSFEKSLDDAEDVDVDEEVADAVVVFLHAEQRDQGPERRGSVFKQTLKHVKWLAGKRGLGNVVLHSFAHLGGESSPPGFTREFMDELARRLSSTGYRVRATPFGWFCSWELSVHGESLAKVWKEI
jgi:hypothetical protein